MYDYVIIGGGIVGLSTAWQLKQRQPDSRVLLLEKEADPIHTGKDNPIIGG